jgi:RNA polymerase sigma-70 factor (ECF subfamily)
LNTQQQQDQMLMLAYAQGDAGAFDQLYEKHKQAVYRFFIRQNLTNAIAEELCHDTWLKLINNRESYQATALFTTFLFTIARRIAIDHSKKKSVILEEPQTEENEQQPISHENQSNHKANQSLAIALKQQIADLPFDQREVFLLKQEAGFSLEDIAKITSQNKEKVKSRWRYALQKMRKGLSFYDQ